jgi:ABC-type glycerol-3-phosphate transport system permease component
VSQDRVLEVVLQVVVILIALMSLTSLASSSMPMWMASERKPYPAKYALRAVKYVLSGIRAIAIGVVAAAIVGVLIALPAAIATVVAAVGLAYGVTEVSDWLGYRSNARRAAQRATGEDETRPGPATL